MELRSSKSDNVSSYILPSPTEDTMFISRNEASPQPLEVLLRELVQGDQGQIYPDAGMPIRFSDFGPLRVFFFVCSMRHRIIFLPDGCKRANTEWMVHSLMVSPQGLVISQ